MSDDSSSTLRVEVRFRNSRLVDAIRGYEMPAMGHTVHARALERYGPMARFCRLHGLSYAAVCELATLKSGPLLKNGTLRPVAAELASILEHHPTWLFPAELYKLTWPRAVAFDMEPAGLVSLQAAPDEALALPPVQEALVLARETSKSLAGVLETLTPREEKILRLRFGLAGGREHTLKEIAESFTLSKDRIRQIEMKALRKMRHPSRSRQLRELIDLEPIK